ncbi:response regulator transcription factor [Micromonospora zhanjiangensis]|uniref:Response regulator transcription factor n=1 Tax=Micromonospora zhanjiangensis TaxID=1522057 RepID=A0ABV8KFW3_9ACTN
MPQLLLIEDDPEIRRALIKTLTELGHVVESATDGLTGLAAAHRSPADLVVLDLGLPDVDGTEVLRMIRAISDVPIIVATARDDEPAIVAALHHGADDYLTKPFGATQLDARIRAVLRRAGTGPADGPIEIGGLVIDLTTRRVTVDGREVELTPREFDLLGYLAARPGTVVTKRELIHQVWRQPAGGADKTVDVHLSWLRRKLGDNAKDPRFLHTLRGVGVKLAAPEGRPGGTPVRP